jgi:hypothetical protein
VATLWLMVTARGRPRLIGAAVFLGLMIKLLAEEPWGPPLRLGGGFDIATAPIAHVTGAAAGLLCGALLLQGLKGRAGQQPVPRA